ncbi:MAG: twin transmembrane helix small protein [Gammaproteobacteria bacterium]|nr:twin transmembrane helix small protein [Gammaproteobacteria bacterium]
MIMKTIVILLLFTIIYCLGSAVFFMIRDKGRSKSMAKALTWRISLSLLLFLLLIIGYAMGWIVPHGVQP